MDEQKKIGTFLNPHQGKVFITFPTAPQMFLYTVFFSAILTRSAEAETIFKVISALASSGPLFTSASHTHLFSSQTWSN